MSQNPCPKEGVTVSPPGKLISGKGTLTLRALEQFGFKGIEPPNSGDKDGDESFKNMLRNIYDSTHKEFIDMLSGCNRTLKSDSQITDEIKSSLYSSCYSSCYSLDSYFGSTPTLEEFSVCETVRILNDMTDESYKNLHQYQMMRVIDFVSTLYGHLVDSKHIQDI